MAFSTIQKKHCKCSPDCDKWPTLSCSGFWFGHMPEHIAKKAGTRRKVAIKNRNRRIAIAHKVKILQKEVDGDYEERLALWFAYHMNKSKRICDNCGLGLDALNDWDWRGCQHHVLDKALFSSVATNPNNHLVIGYYCCHQQIHTSILNASKMDIFPKVKEIVVTLFPLLTDEEKRKCRKLYKDYIPDVLLPYIPNN